MTECQPLFARCRTPKLGMQELARIQWFFQDGEADASEIEMKLDQKLVYSDRASTTLMLPRRIVPFSDLPIPHNC